MKRTILSLAIVAASFGAFAQQTPAPAKKVTPKTEKTDAHKAKKDTVTKTKTVTPSKAAKPAKAKKG